MTEWPTDEFEPSVNFDKFEKEHLEFLAFIGNLSHRRLVAVFFGIPIVSQIGLLFSKNSRAKFLEKRFPAITDKIPNTEENRERLSKIFCVAIEIGFSFKFAYIAYLRQIVVSRKSPVVIDEDQVSWADPSTDLEKVTFLHLDTFFWDLKNLFKDV